MSKPRFDNPADLANEIDQIMSRLNSAALDADMLGNKAAYDLLSSAWSSAFNARSILEGVAQ